MKRDAVVYSVGEMVRDALNKFGLETTWDDRGAFTEIKIKHPLYSEPMLFLYSKDMNPYTFVDSIQQKIHDKWFDKNLDDLASENATKTYRDKLIEQIKAAGQDLIDRAESFVAKDLDMIGGFSIEVDIPQDGPVEFTTRTKIYSKNDEYYKARTTFYADNKPVFR